MTKQIMNLIVLGLEDSEEDSEEDEDDEDVSEEEMDEHVLTFIFYLNLLFKIKLQLRFSQNSRLK